MLGIELARARPLAHLVAEAGRHTALRAQRPERSRMIASATAEQIRIGTIAQPPAIRISSTVPPSSRVVAGRRRTRIIAACRAGICARGCPMRQLRRVGPLAPVAPAARSRPAVTRGHPAREIRSVARRCRPCSTAARQRRRSARRPRGCGWPKRLRQPADTSAERGCSARDERRARTKSAAVVRHHQHERRAPAPTALRRRAVRRGC